MLCTLDDIKARIGEDSSDYDDVLNQIIAAVASMFDSYCNRTLLITESAVTEQVTGYGYMLRVKRYPIVEVTSITEAWDYDFDSVDALTVTDDYIIPNNGDTGVVMRRFGIWPIIPESVQIVYRGGYCAAGVTPTGDEVALPADLREAAIQQSLYIFKRKSADIGLAGQTFEDGGFQKNETGGIIKSAVQVLDRKYKKVSL